MGNKKLKNDYFAKKEAQQFKELFSKYCRMEVNEGHCKDGDCEFCAVNTAYERIFNESFDSNEEEEE